MAATKEDWEKEVAKEQSYHGFLPREDIGSVLISHGDYILRAVEIICEGNRRKKELVVAVLCDPDGKCNKGRPIDADVKEALIKNVIIKHVSGRYAIEAGQRFETIQQLIGHYKHAPFQTGNFVVHLLRAIRLMSWEHYHKDVSVGRLLGQGAFGEVYKGTLKKRANGKEVKVAIKSLKGVISREQIQEMMAEARLQRDLKHRNVVRIYGVALCEQPLYILLEYVKGGGLDAYLKKHDGVIDRDEKLQMVMGAVWGLEYLHRKTIIHRDLASRNCLYDEDKMVKISDFGLSRAATLYKMKTAKKMPIKWMAPESIKEFIFSQKTDVYSMGVLIWEIFACKESYDGLNNTESKDRIDKDNWNVFPAATPPTLVSYVQEKMWNHAPDQRATMQRVRIWMEKFTGLKIVEEEEDSGEPTVNKKPSTISAKLQSRYGKKSSSAGSVLGPPNKNIVN